MPDTDTDNEFALDPIPAKTAPVPAPDVMMTRDPRQGGKGVIKMLVPADEVSNFKAAGWAEAK